MSAETTPVIEFLHGIGAPPILSAIVGILGPAMAAALTWMAKRRIWIFRPQVDINSIIERVRAGEKDIHSVISITDIDFDETLRRYASSVVTNIFRPYIYKVYLGSAEQIGGRNDRFELTMSIMKREILDVLHTEVRNAKRVSKLDSEGLKGYNDDVATMISEGLRTSFISNFKYNDELEQYRVFDPLSSDFLVYMQEIKDSVKTMVETLIQNHVKTSAKIAGIRKIVETECGVKK